MVITETPRSFATSFIRVVITCQPVSNHTFLQFPSPILDHQARRRHEGTADDVKTLPCSAAVDIANFNDYRPSCASSVLRLRIGLVSILWSDQRAMRNP